MVKTSILRASFATAGLLMALGGSVCAEVGVPIALPIVAARDIRFRRVSLEMAHGRVGQMIQDNQGFIWFGTQDGLQRYDGYSLRAFRHDPSNSKSLGGSNIYALFKDREGKIWIGVDKRLDCFDPVSEVFTHIQLDPAVYEGWVSHITEDRDGIFWFSTNHGLTRYDRKTGRAVRFEHSEGDPSSLGGSQVRETLAAKDGALWVATTESVDLFDRQSGKVLLHFPLPLRTAAERPHSEVSLCEDHAGAIWVAFSFGQGLAAVDRRAEKLVYYSLGAASSDKEPLPGLRTIHEDGDGILWLGTAGHGLLKLNRERNEFAQYRNDPIDGDTLSSDQVVSFLEDREGNAWVGTTGGGVNWFQRHPLPFVRYRHEPGNPNSLESDYTSAIHQDRDGNLWVGSMRVLTRINPQTGKFHFYRNAGGPGEISTTWVISIAEDQAGHLWFGTIDGGLNRFDTKTETFKAYRHDPTDPRSLTDDTVLGLYVDRRGALWAGTENGLSRFDPRTGQFQEFRAPSDRRVRYRSIVGDGEGNLWLGTLETGLRRLNPATGEFRDYVHSNNRGSLTSDQVNVTYVDRSGTVWAGTENGLSALDLHSDRFTTYYERDGLASSTVNSILEDDTGSLWISTSRGLSRFNPATKTFDNYHVSDGLLGDEFYNYASAYRSSSGEMFFNSYAGVIGFYPNKLVEPLRSPPVVITQLSLFGKPVSIGGESPLTRSISYAEEITLAHKQSIFSLEFSGLSYTSPQANRYRYRLEGLESAWNEVDSGHRSATYTTLAPGHYIFHVESRVDRGHWGSGALLRITVLPPWWGTVWFRIVFVASILFFLWFIHRVRVSTMEQRNLTLAEELTIRTAAEQEIKALSERLINAQEEERARIARELHDDFSQQIAAVSISLSRYKNQLAEPDRSGQVQSLIERMRDLSTWVRKLSHELHPAILEFADVATVLRTYCEEFSSLNRVSVSFASIGIFRDLPPPVRLCLYRVTQEALRNVLKHSGSGQAGVELVRSDSGSVTLTVSDHGIGFRLDQSRTAGGLGLVSMKERVRVVNGAFECNSELNRGTIIKVTIPCSTDGTGESWPDSANRAEVER